MTRIPRGVSSTDHMTTSMRTEEEDRSHRMEKILNLTLEIINLLTGEGCEVVKKSTGKELKLRRHLPGPSSAVLPTQLLTPERPNMEKVLEITKKMTELLTGEVPIRCQDVSVYFSMEEWEYLEGHRDLYKDVVMESEQIVGEESPREETILRVTLEILSLLTGEECDVMMKPCPEHHTTRRSRRGRNTTPPPPPLRPNMEKILEVTKKMTELLTGKVPIRCQDVSVYFSMEEWEYLEGHRDLYKDVVMENEPPLTSPDGPQISDDDGEDNGTMGRSRGERPFLCSECGKSFKRKEHLQRHVRSHTGERFPCVECGKSFMRKDKLRRHLQIHTGENLNTCLRCGKRFMGKEGLVTHLRTRACKQPCLSTDSSRGGNFNRRWKSRRGEHLFSCSECGKCFDTRSELILHRRLHTGEKIFSCSECGKGFIDRFQLTVHLRSHTGEKPFSCAECERSFTTKSELLAHQRRHTGEKPFPCAECDKSFTTQSELVAHRARHAGKKPFPCLECGKSYSLKADLNTHLKVHTGEKPFCCPECGKGYSRKNELTMHLRSHTGELPFSCSECGKRFAQRGRLLRHQKIHTGERPYSCSECGKSFHEKANLLEHLRRHTGERPFSCSVCGKGFIVKRQLVLHQKSHAGERSFSCPECGKSFNGKRNLSVHRNSHKSK